MWLILMAVGCDRPDTELIQRRVALDAWRSGVAHLDAGDPIAAREAFAAAREVRPDDALLALWEARATATASDLDGAIEMVGEAIALDPRRPEAWYDRAAYAARAGDVARAAPDLRRALELGARRPRDVLDDPDFAPFVGDPALAFLPVEPLQIAVEAPTDTVWWGTIFPVRLRVGGAYDLPLSVTAERVEGPVTLVRVVEDTSPSTAGPMRDLSWSWRVEGTGTADFGPFHTWSGSRRTTTAAVSVPVAAPPDRAPSSKGVRDFATPREIAAGRAPPSAWWVDGELRVLVRPDETVRVEPPSAVPPVVYELRDRGQPLWRLERHTEPAPGARVSVARHGTTLPLDLAAP